jgi:DNA-binding IclR family transcriptional regulator
MAKNKSFYKINDILSLFLKKNKWTLTEISNELRIPKSTVFSILSTLTETSFLEKEANHYMLGMKILRLSNIIRSENKIKDIILPELNQLHNKVNETINLTRIYEYRAIYIESLHSNHPIRPQSSIGITAPLYCTGVGKAMLAFQDDKYIEEYVNKVKLIKHTETTITTRKKLLEELEKIRKKGYANDISEFEEGVRCIAVPLNVSNSKVEYAISIAGIIDRMTPEVIDNYLPLLFNTKKNIESKLKDFWQ